MNRRWTSSDGSIELRLGRWQDVLADTKTCDALICDPPYSSRTDAGFMSHGNTAIAASTDIGYGPIDEAAASELAGWWVDRTRRWSVIFGDHISREWHAAAWALAGWYSFAPVGWVKRGAPPRFRGDGPASQMDHLMVARPRKELAAEDSGSRPGWYLVDTPRAGHAWTGVTGNKDLGGMRALVRDYSRPGDLVVDPYCGGGTTALACAVEGRRCVTAEVDPETFELARKRLAKGYTPDFFFGGVR